MIGACIGLAAATSHAKMTPTAAESSKHAHRGLERASQRLRTRLCRTYRAWHCCRRDAARPHGVRRPADAVRHDIQCAASTPPTSTSTSHYAASIATRVRPSAHACAPLRGPRWSDWSRSRVWRHKAAFPALVRCETAWCAACGGVAASCLRPPAVRNATSSPCWRSRWRTSNP